MNTQVNRTKSTALGKKSNLSCCPVRYQRGLFHQKKLKQGLSGTKKDFIIMILQFTYDFWHWKKDFTGNHTYTTPSPTPTPHPPPPSPHTSALIHQRSFVYFLTQSHSTS